MTHKIYTHEQLEALPLPTLKKIAAQLGTKPVVDARYKKTWICVILRKQSNLQPVVEIEEIEELIIEETPDTLAIDDSLVCGELALEFRNPWASTRKGHIEPSGSIVAEVYQDDRFIGCIRRHYNAAGLFYTTDRHSTTHRTHYAAALSLLDAGEVEIARSTVERDLDDKFIYQYLAPQPAPIPSKQFQVFDYCPKDQSDAAELRQILQNGGRWFQVWSDGQDDYTSVIPGHYRPIGTIKVFPSGKCEYYINRGLNSGRNPIANNLEDAKEGIKRDFITQQSPRAAKAWSDYLGTRSLAFA